MDRRSLLRLGSVAALFSLMLSSPSAAVEELSRTRCTIVGTSGNDRITGTRRADVICGHRGNDVIRGRDGDDVIYGGRGDDSVVGGRGSDRLAGGRGLWDTISAGPGRDLLIGKVGTDCLDAKDGSSRDLLRGGPDLDYAAHDRGDRGRSVERRSRACPLQPVP
jgi:Ca2+-binding RTX toxin-like protein